MKPGRMDLRVDDEFLDAVEALRRTYRRMPSRSEIIRVVVIEAARALQKGPAVPLRGSKAPAPVEAALSVSPVEAPKRRGRPVGSRNRAKSAIKASAKPLDIRHVLRPLIAQNPGWPALSAARGWSTHKMKMAELREAAELLSIKIP